MKSTKTGKPCPDCRRPLVLKSDGRGIVYYYCYSCEEAKTNKQPRRKQREVRRGS